MFGSCGYLPQVLPSPIAPGSEGLRRGFITDRGISPVVILVALEFSLPMHPYDNRQLPYQRHSAITA